MEITLTAVFRKFPEGYAAFVEELPGANTQGATLEEARANLKEAVEMVLQANRELAEARGSRSFLVWERVSHFMWIIETMVFIAFALLLLIYFRRGADAFETAGR
jgi:predicted RNase H-like HicB family nuclease